MAKTLKPVVAKPKQKLLKRLLPVRVEFPQENETVVTPTYTFHIAASKAAVMVDVCINQGVWLPCRESLGIWWHDWNTSDNSGYEIVARARQEDGTVMISEPRVFFVKRA